MKGPDRDLALIKESSVTMLTSPWKRSRSRAWLLVLALLFGVVGCTEGKSSIGGPKPVLVDVTEVVQQDVPVRIQALGNVEATQSVAVKALVTGQLLEVNFAEGAEVAKGEILFEIDPRPYLATLHQAQANLARDEAQARSANDEFARYAPLVDKDLVSKDQLSQLRATADALAATVEGDHASVESAQLQLGYCRILSPIDGVVGASLVDTGNVVKANDATLVTINQIAPISVAFAVPGQDLSDVREAMALGTVQVQAVLPGSDALPVAGRLFFINNTVDAGTGSIGLKATFDNADRKLWPGQFVSVLIELAVRPGALVIPSKALQSGQQGQFVYVVRPDSTAELRVVTVDFASGDLAVIQNGLSAGDKVVTDGQLQVAPGGAVTVREGSVKAASRAPVAGAAP
jgi:membrane fusion protein, multidrug efflux system